MPEGRVWTLNAGARGEGSPLDVASGMMPLAVGVAGYEQNWCSNCVTPSTTSSIYELHLRKGNKREQKRGGQSASDLAGNARSVAACLCLHRPAL